MEELKITIGILSLVLVLFAGACEAVMDKIQFHYDRSIFNDTKYKYKQEFWNPTLSWINKWKDGSAREEKFLGSSTIFVFTTDAWHLFKFFRNTSLFIGLPLMFFLPINILVLILIARVLYGITFNLYFDKILNKK